ncbi:hypothetical protein [Marinagarivorans cellulosilyticus]|uniref:Uncharacterized protein n=1 Tax=Marinagarivorans cellulosilyticus TaxID=2721545 RepID=A0AAN2BKR4_9GAMM|nr:hypothetical protein [Marinagarivorans cellulosilyticus]BCD98296.1 hypothetical protein MARGE09_P2497 [Marinagarivorans cellulosilyticus]
MRDLALVGALRSGQHLKWLGCLVALWALSFLFVGGYELFKNGPDIQILFMTVASFFLGWISIWILGYEDKLYYSSRGFVINETRMFTKKNTRQLPRSEFRTLLITYADNPGLSVQGDGRFRKSMPKDLVVLHAVGRNTVPIDSYVKGRQWKGERGVAAAKVLAHEISRVTKIPVSVKISK